MLWRVLTGLTGSRILVIPLLAGLLALGLTPAPAVADACGPVATAAATAHDVLQDDGNSSRDAGDTPATAVPLAPDPSYSWGFVEPAGRRTGADTEDWFSVALPGDSRTLVMFELNATFARAEDPAYSGSLLPPEARFRIAAFPPDGGAPIAGQPNGIGGERLHFRDARAGTWYLRVTWFEGVDAGPCAGATGASADPGAKGPATNYGVYFGCEPICDSMRRSGS